MTENTEAPRPWVPVLDMTFVLATVDTEGKNVRLVYSVREHKGDVVKAMPGGFEIKREGVDIEREGETYRVPGETVNINCTNVIAIERSVRLEKRERLSAREMMAQADELDRLAAQLRDKQLKRS
jgi:hypothetical protein